MIYILFDIGGTKTRVAISHDLEKLDKVESFKTPGKYQEGKKMLIDKINVLTEGSAIKAIAGGIRGRLTEDKGGIDNDGVLTDWAKKPLVDDLTKAFKAPVFLENDSAVAGLGEAVYGAGKGSDIVAYHTISTGVGGAKIESGDIAATSVGFEPGHQIIDVDRTVLGKDITPTLENMVSGTAVESRFGVKPYEIPQSDVLWRDLAGYLSQGLRNTTLYWSPEVIVLGGSMITGNPRIEIDDIRKATVEALDGFVETPHIAVAKLGDEAGLYGAMALIKKRHKR